jgi:hypothetical protein
LIQLAPPAFQFDLRLGQPRLLASKLLCTFPLDGFRLRLRFVQSAAQPIKFLALKCQAAGLVGHFLFVPPALGQKRGALLTQLSVTAVHFGLLLRQAGLIVPERGQLLGEAHLLLVQSLRAFAVIGDRQPMSFLLFLTQALDFLSLLFQFRAGTIQAGLGLGNSRLFLPDVPQVLLQGL